MADPHVRRRGTGGVFRGLRLDAGWTIKEASTRLDCSPDRMTRIEEGLAALRLAEARDLLDLYRASGEIHGAVLRAVRASSAKTWWYPFGDLIDGDFETLLILEDEASQVTIHQPNLVPGLLQTRRYGWELMSTLSDFSLDDIERRAQLRAARQRVFSREPPLRLAVMLDEAALRRPVGGPDVMREQFERLIEVAMMPTVTLRIRPLRASPHPAVGFAFHIFEFAGDDPRITQIECFDRERFAQEPAEVGRYAEAYDDASCEALDPADSLTFLRELAR